ncbi:MAG: hypothetical protein J7J05_01565 [Thermococcus sp.]|uniref:hypothetical protein n=1 Tax=Thermococcus sp. TaxID=35749 RepID=UPI000F2137D6|nr:hypothetical protein [Thermococcus sp.]MCD6139628.1 hypothetical protein [Thermococcus sp.]MCD6143591.1 hypothetical protein [Thermococcus sp.]RLF84887.1 MAG: hypothetical protein DRN48_04535 [Thermococci archaeon]
MSLRKLLLGVIVVILIYVVLFSRALIIETKVENMPRFGEVNFKECPAKIEIKEVRDKIGNYVNFYHT